MQKAPWGRIESSGLLDAMTGCGNAPERTMPDDGGSGQRG